MRAAAIIVSGGSGSRMGRPKQFLPLAGSTVAEWSLKCFVDRGAAISWAGGWECFLHYSRDETFAGCYAAYTLETGLICHSGLDEPLTYLEEIPFAANRLHSSVAAASRKH